MVGSGFAMIDDSFRSPAANDALRGGRQAAELSQSPVDPTMTAPTALEKPRDDTPTHADRFPVATAELERIAAVVLDAARKGGATAAETDVSQGVGQSVTVRKGEVETIAYNRDKGVSVTVYLGPAARAREQRRLLRRVDPRHGRQGARDRALHGRGSVRGARRRRPARAQLAGSRPLPSLEPHRRRRRSSSGARPRPRRWPWTAASPTRRARRCRAARASSSTRTRWASPAATGARAITSTSRDRRGQATACSATTGTRPRARRRISQRADEVGRSGRRAHRPPARRAAARHDRMPGALRGARSRGPDRRVRAGGLGRQPLPQVARSCSTRSGRQIFAPHVSIARGAAPPARRAAARRSTRRRGDRRRATSSRDGVVQRLFPRQLLGAQARHEHDRQRAAAATTSWSRTATTTCRR